MPDQLLFAILALVFLFLLEFVLSLIPGDPFKYIKVVGNVLRFQRGSMSRQVAVQKANIKRVTITPGHVCLTLDEQHGNRVLNLNFKRSHTQALYQFLDGELTGSQVQLAAAGSAELARPS